jgi:hypothetical protein
MSWLRQAARQRQEDDGLNSELFVVQAVLQAVSGIGSRSKARQDKAEFAG